MKIHKRRLLAGLAAVLALSALTAASASAAVWKDKGVNVSKFVEIGLTGGELAEAGGKGLSCELHATLTTEGGSTGKITKYETKKCTGFGELSTCEMATSESKGLPWTVDVNAADLTITNWHLRRTFKAGCATTEIDKTVGSVTVTLDVPSAITEMEFLGEITGFKTFGSFTVDSPNSGTYGIG
jgi:hypothetical protein